MRKESLLPWPRFAYLTGYRQSSWMSLPHRALFRYLDSMSSPAITAPQTVPVISEYIAIEPGYCGGKPHIAGHRIKVQHVVVWHEQLGMTPAEIVATYPTVTLAAVHAALAYYYGHRADIDADIAADRRFAAELQAKMGPSKLQAKLQQLHAADDQVPPG
jgi:uncharacterized protein (DUF433 family)